MSLLIAERADSMIFKDPCPHKLFYVSMILVLLVYGLHDTGLFYWNTSWCLGANLLLLGCVPTNTSTSTWCACTIQWSNLKATAVGFCFICFCCLGVLDVHLFWFFFKINYLIWITLQVQKTQSSKRAGRSKTERAGNRNQVETKPTII